MKEVHPNRYYRLVNGDIARITKVNETPWGIHGEYFTGERMGGMELWNDEEYPFRMSWDKGDDGYRLTDKEITQEEDPEYFL